MENVVLTVADVNCTDCYSLLCYALWIKNFSWELKSLWMCAGFIQTTKMKGT